MYEGINRYAEKAKQDKLDFLFNLTEEESKQYHAVL
jgi:hypothetical protein